MTSTSTPRSLPFRLFDCAAHLLVLLAFVLVVLSLRITTVVCIPFRCSSKPRIVRFLFRRGLAFLWLFFDFTRLVRITCEGEPICPGSAVLIANHPSLIDALTLIPRLPRTACLYKANLERMILPRSLAERAGFISNAGGMESIRTAVDRLQNGWRVLVFPEGTRTTVAPMGPWKSSYALMAARAEVPIQPIYIHVDHPIFAKNNPWWRPAHFPVHISLRFGSAVPPPSSQSVRRFHQDLEASFRQELLRSDQTEVKFLQVR